MFEPKLSPQAEPAVTQNPDFDTFVTGKDLDRPLPPHSNDIIGDMEAAESAAAVEAALVDKLGRPPLPEVAGTGRQRLDRLAAVRQTVATAGRVRRTKRLMRRYALARLSQARYAVMHQYLTKDISAVLGHKDFTLHFVLLGPRKTTAQVIARLVAEGLLKRQKLPQLVGGLCNHLVQERVLTGYMVEAAGRFDRADMAETIRIQKGRTRLNELAVPVSYGTAIAKLKYGIAGIKVWLTRPHRDW